MPNKLIKYLTLILVCSLGIIQPLQAAAETPASLPADDRLLSEIQARGVLRFGTASGYAPFEFTVLEDGSNQVVGVDVFLAQQIADDLGVDLEIIDMEFGSLIPAMETGKLDIIISGMSYTPERNKSVDFSDFYNQDNQYLIIRQDSKDRIKDVSAFEAGGSIGVSDNTLQDRLVDEMIPGAKKVAMRKTADAISALLAKQVDAVLSDESVAKAFEAEHPNLLAIPSNLDVSADGKSVALPKNQPSLLAAVNQTVKQAVESGQMDEWLDESYRIIKSQQQTSWLKYWPYFWSGIKITFAISITAILVGIICGFFLALMRLSRSKVLQGLATIYVNFIRGTPMMVQILFIFLVMGNWPWVSPLLSGMIAVSLNSSAYICEIFRGGINGVDRGQMEAARSLGLNYWQAMRKIILPQSLRSIWPALSNEFITLIKDSSIVSTIGVAELTFQTRAVTSLTYQGIIPLLISMCCYFALTYLLGKGLHHLESQQAKKYA